jgi:hypothetical protein
LGFDVAKLNRILQTKGEYGLVACVYDRTQQEELINQTIDSAIDLWKHRRDPMPSGAKSRRPFRIFPPIALRLYSCFLAPVLKNVSFSEEKEWRLIALQNDARTHKFRSGGSVLIPFIEIDLLEKRNVSNSMPVSEIIVGPTAHPDLASLSIRMLIESHGLKAHTKVSTIPFRSL